MSVSSFSQFSPSTSSSDEEHHFELQASLLGFNSSTTFIDLKKFDNVLSNTSLLKDNLIKLIIDTHMQNGLEAKSAINWLPSLAKLYPLQTTADGNCLVIYY